MYGATQLEWAVEKISSTKQICAAFCATSGENAPRRTLCELSVYQLAQGALQLTGTGVGVLNQASEGNWFPAALEQASKGASEYATFSVATKTTETLFRQVEHISAFT